MKTYHAKEYEALLPAYNRMLNPTSGSVVTTSLQKVEEVVGSHNQAENLKVREDSEVRLVESKVEPKVSVEVIVDQAEVIVDQAELEEDQDEDEVLDDEYYDIQGESWTDIMDRELLEEASYAGSDDYQEDLEEPVYPPALPSSSAPVSTPTSNASPKQSKSESTQQPVARGSKSGRTRGGKSGVARGGKSGRTRGGKPQFKQPEIVVPSQGGLSDKEYIALLLKQNEDLQLFQQITALAHSLKQAQWEHKHVNGNGCIFRYVMDAPTHESDGSFSHSRICDRKRVTGTPYCDYHIVKKFNSLTMPPRPAKKPAHS